MRRGALITFTIACATVLGSVIVFHPGSAQEEKRPPPVYNPYPAGLLPAVLHTGIERVNAEIDNIFVVTLAAW
jgi:hypothetical protein